ncbi:MAG: DUF721 domain-containing protein [Alphaproteobacteria bacterium]|nr:DUF721 domain-containing protein [Alphaproteobacteria bacterium]
MRPLSEATARVAGKSFERKYIALGRIVNHWNDIVGTKLADKAQPMKIHYRKKKEHAAKPDAVLEIAASSADATLLHYQKDLILARINQIFGESWITGIRFINTPVNASGLTRRRKKTVQPLTGEKKKHLSLILEDVADADIRVKLENLGQAILAENR